MMTGAPPAALNRTLAPAAQPVRSVALPTPEVRVLAGGNRLHVLRHKTLPVVQVQVVVRAGTWQQPASGLANLTARALAEGTRHHSAAQIAEHIATYGAFMEHSAGADRATLTLYCLSRHLSALLPLLGELLSEATYPDREVEAVKARYAQAVRVDREKVAFRATERFSRNLFGPEHPYCVEVDLERVAVTSADELRAFYAQRWALVGADILVAGDVSDALLEQLVAALPLQTAGPAPLLVGPPITATPVALDEIRLEKSMQSAVRVGRLWPGPHHADVHPLFLLNKLLGGYFGSRLMKNIREDKGFTYGIHSSIQHREHASTLVIGADVNVESTAATFTEIHRELARLREELVPEDELEVVRQYSVGKFLSDTSTIFDQLSKYQFLILHGLSPDYYLALLRAIQETSAEELRTLANQYLAADALLELAVGRR